MIASEKDIHPCFSCPLPDCDDKLSLCPLRQILSRESTMRRQGVKVSQTLRQHRSIAYREIYYWERRVRREEARA